MPGNKSTISRSNSTKSLAKRKNGELKYMLGLIASKPDSNELMASSEDSVLSESNVWTIKRIRTRSKIETINKTKTTLNELVKALFL